MILVFDIGGTKVRAARYRRQDGGLKLEHKDLFLTAKWPHFTAILQSFVGDDKPEDVEGIAIGVAGPVMKLPIHLTNLNWTVDPKELKTFAPNAQVFIMNDLIAHAWGVSLLSDGDMEVIHPGRARVGNRAVIAAGTGLGMALLTPMEGNQWVSLASEGGHSTFGPRTERDIALLRFLMNRYGDHVSWERVVSGKYGFRNIADFLFATGQYNQCSDFMTSMGDIQDVAGPIARGLDDGVVLAQDTMRMFCSLYGAVTGNLALMSLPFGGIYLTGGISRKFSRWWHHGEFVDAFVAMGRMRDTLEQIPIYLVKDEDLAMRGLAHYVEVMLDEQWN